MTDRYLNQVIKDQELRLDNTHCEDVIFRNARLLYGGRGPVSLVSCNMMDCTFVFTHEAGSTVDFLRNLKASWPGATYEYIIDGAQDEDARHD